MGVCGPFHLQSGGFTRDAQHENRSRAEFTFTRQQRAAHVVWSGRDSAVSWLPCGWEVLTSPSPHPPSLPAPVPSLTPPQPHPTPPCPAPPRTFPPPATYDAREA